MEVLLLIDLLYRLFLNRPPTSFSSCSISHDSLFFINLFLGLECHYKPKENKTIELEFKTAALPEKTYEHIFFLEMGGFRLGVGGFRFFQI